MRVLYKLCREEDVVERGALKDLRGTRGDLKDDEVLWEIAAPPKSRLTDFTVGVLPEGFSESVVLTPPVPGALLNLHVKSSALPSGESMTFRMTELRTNEFRVGTEYMSEEEFKARPACD